MTITKKDLLLKNFTKEKNVISGDMFPCYIEKGVSDMNIYEYQGYKHFENAYKKVIDNTLGVSVSFGDDFKKKLERLYQMYEEGFELFKEKSIRSPLDVLLKDVYENEYWEDYIENVNELLDRLLHDYESVYMKIADEVKYLESVYIAIQKKVIR